MSERMLSSNTVPSSSAENEPTVELPMEALATIRNATAASPQVAQLRQAAVRRREERTDAQYERAHHRAENRGWRGHKLGIAAGAAAVAAVVGIVGAGMSALHSLERATASGQKYTAAPQKPYSPSPEASSASASASASASISPSTLPSAVKTSASPTHKTIVIAPVAPSVKPKPTTASPSPVHTTPKPEAECWTEPSSPDPIIECSPAATPVDIAGSKGYESNLTISANSTNVHVNLSDVISVGGTNYVEVYDPAQANNGTGWIPEADLAGQH